MADQGLEEAIRAVGGVTELARRIGISQPSVSNWTRIPAERVRTVETVSGVARATLRPDLYGEAAVDDVDLARAHEYSLLAALLLRAPDAKLLAKIAELGGDATPLGIAHVGLAEAAGSAEPEKIQGEYFDLFIGIGRGELLPYASYYLTGFLHERPLARLRDDLARLGIARADGVVEPEDHAGILCEVMSGLASGQLHAPAESGRTIFEKHMAPWIGRFFADLERAEAANFYRRVAAIGRLFVEIETEAFALPS
ncbi:MAG TPA: molecular chaperone TorD family protein [Pseudolabrys sp.]|nr:molecular chaperone TorD family protein [Pseudolabrys sp.]